ncbi:MAG TPA: iron-containing redox enzyme family protein [Polyangia bacterium]|jgi:hypothetical protein|nr:iron-containing redox enzyme family protein [Polyangia bacterium]
MIELVQKLYEPHIQAARARLGSDPEIRALVDPGIEPLVLERFLIQYTALGVRMTEPVEGWIRRAGERCVALGLEEVGQKLMSHARHEAGHHLLMVNDTRYLVARWNARHGAAAALDAEALLGQAPPAPVLAYVKLHEDTIASDTPEGQVAIEFEIERLSLEIGAPFVANCQRVLGAEIMKGMTFVTEHVELDEGHTALNERMLGRLLAMRPERAQALAQTGAEALRIYGAFLASCLDAGRRAVGGGRAALAS